MSERQFIHWLSRQNLKPHQVKMARILFSVNGYENAREFVEKVKGNPPTPLRVGQGPGDTQGYEP